MHRDRRLPAHVFLLLLLLFHFFSRTSSSSSSSSSSPGVLQVVTTVSPPSPPAVKGLARHPVNPEAVLFCTEGGIYAVDASADPANPRTGVVAASEGCGYGAATVGSVLLVPTRSKRRTISAYRFGPDPEVPWGASAYGGFTMKLSAGNPTRISGTANGTVAVVLGDYSVATYALSGSFSPPQLGEVRGINGTDGAMAVGWKAAYICTPEGLVMVDLADPAAPSKVALPEAPSCTAVAAGVGTLFVGTQEGSVVGFRVPTGSSKPDFSEEAFRYECDAPCGELVAGAERGAVVAACGEEVFVFPSGDVAPVAALSLETTGVLRGFLLALASEGLSVVALRKFDPSNPAWMTTQYIILLSVTGVGCLFTFIYAGYRYLKSSSGENLEKKREDGLLQ